MYSELFSNQVSVLLRCLPALQAQTDFALKGGTALNLFMQNMPRLSIDIDLTFTEIADRETSLERMQISLKTMAARIKQLNPEFSVHERLSQKTKQLVKLLVSSNNAQIKIEPNFIMRGTLYPIEQHELSEAVRELFMLDVGKIPMLNVAELYAGKICAALDRQHPRDLFDIHVLLKAGKLSDKIRQAFIVYLACGPRPMHELLSPNLLDISTLYHKEFIEMVVEPISLETLLIVREQLIDGIHQSLTQSEKAFLLSVKTGDPDYSLMPFSKLETLPALQWKLLNIRKMDKAKKQLMLDKLKVSLDG